MREIREYLHERKPSHQGCTRKTLWPESTNSDIYSRVQNVRSAVLCCCWVSVSMMCQKWKTTDCSVIVGKAKSAHMTVLEVITVEFISKSGKWCLRAQAFSSFLQLAHILSLSLSQQCKCVFLQHQHLVVYTKTAKC